MTLTLTLTDDTMAALAREAEATGLTVEQIAAARLEPPAREQTVAEWYAERYKGEEPPPLIITRGTGEPGLFNRNFGIFSSGLPPLSNEEIDAALAREYGNTHDAG